ncbi:ATP-binding protein [Thalassoglobus sp.]|uniref:sensor histidine kinase n=1 Tax=Thalassoglobus sp. TaxID=2795869 RepID=UPI003AA89FEB
MLLSNTMWRKLMTNLGLVVFMLFLFAFSSFAGINSYSRMVNDLELSITNMPSRDRLIASLANLLKPFKVDLPDESKPHALRVERATMQHDQFEQELANVTVRIDQFEQAFQKLPDNLRPGYAEESSYFSMFRTIHQRLETLKSERDLLFDPDLRDGFIRGVTRTVAELTEIAESLPDPSNRLGERLKEARDDKQIHLRVVAATGLLSLVLLGLLIYCSWRWIFKPILGLTEGVEKLSAGNYNYRLDVKTQCELSQMANTFNEMAAKIEQDQLDKEEEIKNRSKQLVQSERLAGVGFLASGVAHEINNPLSVIMNAINGVQRRLTDDVLAQLPDKDRKRILDYLDLVLSEAERCETITKKLLDFSYGKADERNLYDIVAVCQEVASMVGHLSKYQQKQVTVDRTDPLHAWVNGPEIKQVVLNLVANALDASEDGNSVEVSVKELPDQVEIAVTDHGAGMTAEQQTKIFEPFFTTKEVGKGTGLGLSITHRIVVDHNGRLEVNSNGPGTGSTFTLRLPKNKKQARAA